MRTKKIEYGAELSDSDNDNGDGQSQSRRLEPLQLPQQFWWDAVHELKTLLTQPTPNRTRKPRVEDLGRDERLLPKRESYKSRIEQRLNLEASIPRRDRTPPDEKFLVYKVVKNAGGIDLCITLFLLRLILEHDPMQICSSEDNVPLIHHAIEAEVNSSHARGLTSAMCELAGNPYASEALAKTNNDEENSIHLLIRHNIYDARNIILLLNADVAVKANMLKQKRTSSDKSEDGNTPLHDVLHFNKVAIRTIPCEEQPKLCAACDDAESANINADSMFKFYRKLVSALGNKCADVLTQHNSMGQSPYSFHLTTKANVLRNRAAQIAGKYPAQNGSKAVNGEEGQRGDKPKTSKDAKFKEQLSTHQGATATSQTMGPIVNRDIGQNPKNEGGQNKGSNNSRNSTIMQSGPDTKNTESHEHMWEYDGEWSDRLVKYLEEEIFSVTGEYQNVVDFFYQSAEKTRTRDTRHAHKDKVFQLPKRITDQTVTNYDFLDFEPRLALVTLSLKPDLAYEQALTKDGAEALAKRDEKNIIAVFRWLRDKKKVTKILKLEVRDNPQRFCSEGTLEKCFECMDEIRFLDWDKPDMSVSLIAKAKQLIDVHLYSSGISAVLHHWSDQNGLIQLPKLKSVHLKARKGIDGDARDKANLRTFEEKLKNEYRKKGATEKITKLVHDAQDQARKVSGDEKLKLMRMLEELRSLLHVDSEKSDKNPTEDDATDSFRYPKVTSKIIGMGDRDSSPDRNASLGFSQDRKKHPGFEAVKIFGLRLYDPLRSSRTKKIKVALIDDGVDPEYQNIGSYLARSGFPPSSLNGHIAPFYTSTKEHGSKMAWIISTICPFVEISVAKIDIQYDLPHPQFTVEQAAAAVEWAIEGDVDLISMSWIFQVTDEVHEDARKLKGLLSDDSCKPIVYCAARDSKGNDQADSSYYPADCPISRRIGGADVYCDPQQYVTLDKTSFLFPSENVLDHPYDGGNSVATAIATGVAALVLYCFKEDNVSIPDQLKPSLSATALMARLFAGLQVNKKTKYVDLAKLFKVSDERDFNPGYLVKKVCLYAGVEIQGRGGNGDHKGAGGFHPNKLIRQKTDLNEGR